MSKKILLCCMAALMLQGCMKSSIDNLPAQDKNDQSSMVCMDSGKSIYSWYTNPYLIMVEDDFCFKDKSDVNLCVKRKLSYQYADYKDIKIAKLWDRKYNYKHEISEIKEAFAEKVKNLSLVELDRILLLDKNEAIFNLVKRGKLSYQYNALSSFVGYKIKESIEIYDTFLCDSNQVHRVYFLAKLNINNMKKSLLDDLSYYYNKKMFSSVFKGIPLKDLQNLVEDLFYVMLYDRYEDEYRYFEGKDYQGDAYKSIQQSLLGYDLAMVKSIEEKINFAKKVLSSEVKR